MSTYAAPRGPAPKPESQRRRRTKPVSYGAAEPVVAGRRMSSRRWGSTGACP